MMAVAPSQQPPGEQPREQPPGNRQPDVKRWLKTIWLKPRVTIEEVVAHHPAFGQWQILAALILATSLIPLKDIFMPLPPQLTMIGLPAFLTGLPLIAVNLPVNLITYLVSVYLTAGLMLVTGKPLDGQAGFTQLATAISWSFVPIMFGALFVMVASITSGPLYWLAQLVDFACLIWAFKLIIFTVAGVQRYSIGKSIVNHLFVLALLLLPLAGWAGMVALDPALNAALLVGQGALIGLMYVFARKLPLAVLGAGLTITVIVQVGVLTWWMMGQMMTLFQSQLGGQTIAW